MIHSDLIPRELREGLASLVARRLSPLGLEAARARKAIELSEHFAIWSMEGQALAQPGSDLKNLAHPTGYWHHQLKHGGKAAEFAISAPGPGACDPWDLHGVFTSPLASKAERALRLINQETSEDALIRLLVVPAYAIHAFWLAFQAGDNRVLVYDRPRRMQALLTLHGYPAAEFLEILRKLPPVQGMTRSQA